MAILTDNDKREIRERVISLSIKDDYQRNREYTLQIALLIIRKVLGEEWYNDANKGFAPLSYFLRETPFGKDRIIQFARFLKLLYKNGTNLENKLEKYSKEREKDHQVSLQKFKSLFFELQMASYFKERGLDVQFLEEQKGKIRKKMPDFRVSSSHGTTYVECKKKDSLCREDLKIKARCKTIIDKIFSKMKESELNYSFRIMIRREITDDDVPLIVQFADRIIARRENFCKTSFGEIEVEAERLLDWGVVESSKRIPTQRELMLQPDIISADIKFSRFYSNYALCTEDMVNTDKIKEMLLPITNYKQIVICSPFPVTKVQSIKLSIRQGSQQLLGPKSSGYGIVAVDITDLTLGLPDDTNKAEKIKADIWEVIHSLDNSLTLGGQLEVPLEQMPHVSAVVFFISRGEIVDDKTRFMLQLVTCRNNLTSHPLPPEIAYVLTKVEKVKETPLDD